MLRGPGVPEDARVADLTANIDLAPTIVDTADATSGRVLDGQSLLPLARHPDDFTSRDILLRNHPSGAEEDSEDPAYFGVRTPRYTYVEYETGERELYDLQADPHELHSRHDDPEYAAVQRELAVKLERLRDCTGLTCRSGP